MRVKFNLLPASIPVAWYKQAGNCSGWPLQQKKATATVTTVVLALKKCSQVKRQR